MCTQSCSVENLQSNKCNNFRINYTEIYDFATMKRTKEELKEHFVENKTGCIKYLRNIIG